MITPLHIAEQAFSEIQGSFPDLVSRLEPEHEGGLDLEVTFPEQPGLAFEVSLNLQNTDELHLCAPGFWMEWFPCTDADVVARYLEAVRGLLAGSYRILQHHRSDRLRKSELQRPAGDGWETIARYYPGFAFSFRRREERVVQNTQPSNKR